MLNGTRLIYNGDKKEASMTVTNTQDDVYLIQSWVDLGENNPAKAPFIVTPPLFRLDGMKKNVIRVIRSGGDFPTDRESMFWLNVKAIPSSTKKNNVLTIAVKTRIKLIYRPSSVSGTPDEAARNLLWSHQGSKLTVKNNSPFWITFQQVLFSGSEIKEPGMVAPFSSLTMDSSSGKGSSVTWSIINDYGGFSTPQTGTVQ